MAESFILTEIFSIFVGISDNSISVFHFPSEIWLFISSNPERFSRSGSKEQIGNFENAKTSRHIPILPVLQFWLLFLIRPLAKFGESKNSNSILVLILYNYFYSPC